MPFTFGDEHARPAPRLIAQQTAEMVCYLWFASAGSLARASSTTTTTTSKSAPPRTADTARLALQLSASGAFVDFVLKLLDTTQVSQSVIVLSLHYIYRLKEAGIFALERTGAGSERRVTVVALMLANKFVDDNTYTNKTWSEVAGIGLSEINAMEREFLGAVGYRLAIDAGTYAKWLNLLRGLVQAKDRELRWWARAHSRATPVNDSIRAATPRARSSSPTPHSVFPFTFTVPQPVHQQHRQDYVPPYSAPAPAAESPPVLRKRPAREAFSPPSYASSIPAKRPLTDPRGREDAVMQQHQQQPPQLYIQTHLIAQQQQQPISAGGVERSFARLSLQHPQQPSPHTLDSSSYAQTWRPTADSNNNGGSNHNNVAASAAPQPLYYYKLASSPAEPVASTAESERERKGRLQYHQPALSTVHHSHHTHVHPAHQHQQVYALLTPATATGVHQHQHHQHRFELGTGGGRHALSANASPLGIAPTSSSSYQIYPQPQQQQRQVVQPHLHNILTPPPSAPFQQVYTAAAPPPTTAEVRPYAQHAPFANAGPAGVRMHWATSAPPASVPVPVPVAVQVQQEARARNAKRYPTPPQQQYPTPPLQQYPTPPSVQQQFPTPPSAQFYSPAVSSWQQHQPSPYVQAAQDQWPHALHHHAHTRVPAIPADWVQPPMVV